LTPCTTNKMTIKDSTKIALDNFKRHKIRTFLSMLGIVIGILSVSMILSLGQGVTGYVTGQITAFGTDVIDVATKVPGKGAMGTLSSMVQGVTVTSLTREDFEAMEEFDFVTNQTSYAFGQAWTSHKDKENNSFLFITTADYSSIDKQAKIAEGRFYNEREDEAAQKVVVLGKDVREELFENKPALGKKVKIKGHAFKVIGVFQKRGQIAGFNYDNLVTMPLKTGQKLILGIDHVVEGLVKVKPDTNISVAVSRIESLLRRRHNIFDPEKDDFMVMSMEEALEIAQEITNALSILLIFLASISLLVGGVGIMNIMLVSLSERIREVGLRKAVGATDKEILHQFLIESTLLTSIGGTVGVILALIFTVTGAFAARQLGIGWEISFPLTGVLIALAVSIGIGLLFGLYPARKAAQLDPIGAIREE